MHVYMLQNHPNFKMRSNMYACKSLWPPSSWSYLSDDILVSEGTYGEHEKKKNLQFFGPHVEEWVDMDAN